MVPPPVKVRMRMLIRMRMRILTSVVMFYITLHSVICRYGCRCGLVYLGPYSGTSICSTVKYILSLEVTAAFVSHMQSALTWDWIYTGCLIFVSLNEKCCKIVAIKLENNYISCSLDWLIISQHIIYMSQPRKDNWQIYCKISRKKWNET